MTAQLEELAGFVAVDAARVGYVCMYVCIVITYSSVWVNRVRLQTCL